MADRSIVKPEGKIEDLLVKVDKFILPTDFIILDYEADDDVAIILGRPFLEIGGAVINVQKGELTMRVHDDEIKFNIVKAIKFQDEGEDLEECYALTLLNNQHSRKTEEEEYEEEEEDPQQEEQICYLQERRPEPLIRTKKEKQLKRPSSEKPPELELKPLPQHLKYAYLGNNKTLPVIISSFLTKEQEGLLLDKLKKYQGAIGWTIADLKGISPSFCMHKILLTGPNSFSVEHQRRLNPIMKEVVRKEVIKWLDAGIIYPISDSSWVSPIQCIPKKGGITVEKNEKNELIPVRKVTGWRICQDYRKLNNATRKDHFPLPFTDQMLDHLAGKEYFCFLDGYSGYNQIALAPEDQHKTTFTCPYGTFAFRMMPFGLCNAPATFQRCMLSIFSDLIGEGVEVFMDDVSVLGTSYDHCLNNLEEVLQRCLSSNLVLNWEKYHFMVKERIVLGHKISREGLEVDQAKVEAIAKMPPPDPGMGKTIGVGC
ncbi:uncharacterized protein LOC133285009 [Gastrolobium bilobum]|uniref:uncharacterized protein LOC133285009 n=1 Tax=Gastrolobium bilobum TaxID=150636 RepID=UPI002AB1600B|nr:uncharacterized protein LOC133285009 [Gastrolobium bilobum]